MVAPKLRSFGSSTAPILAGRSGVIAELAQPEVRTPDPARLAETGDSLAIGKNGRVALRRMDNVGIVVESLDAAISFFAELGLELEGRAHDRRRLVRARYWAARRARRDRHDAYAGWPRQDRTLAFSRAACGRRSPERAGERSGLPACHVRGGRPRRYAGPAPRARRAARRRSCPVRRCVSALLRPRPRGHSHRVGRANRLTPDTRSSVIGQRSGSSPAGCSTTSASPSPTSRPVGCQNWRPACKSLISQSRTEFSHPTGSVLGVYGRESGISRPATVGDGRNASRASLTGWASGLGLICVVTAITLAIRAHELPLTPFVASATKIASGQIWVLAASALVVDRPVLIGLAVFGLLAVATLRLCGARTFWLAAAAGHAGSTLLVYAIIGSTQLADPQAFASAAVRPDFGVSAIQGAWVGVITATAWSRAGSDQRNRGLVAAGVCAVAGVGWWLHPDPSILTTEHLFAFLIGAGIVSRRRLADAARTAASRRFVPERRNRAQHV